MLTFNPALQTILDGAVDKTDSSNKLKAALGVTRRLRCWRDSASNATSPRDTGTEVLNVGFTGDLIISAGNIVGFGLAAGTTVRLAADLETGSSVLRVEGGGNWVQGTFGLSFAEQKRLQMSRGVIEANVVYTVYDFYSSANLSATAGIGFTESAGIKPVRFLPVGIGPAAPIRTLDMPAAIQLYSCPSAGVRTLMFTNPISVREDNFVLQDKERALELGDAAIYRTPSDMAFSTCNFGATFWLSHESNTEVGNVPLIEVAIGQVSNVQPGWPNAANVNPSIPRNCAPFEIDIVDGNTPPNVLKTHKMQSEDKPINDPSLKSGRLVNGSRDGRSGTQALNPQYTPSQMLVWWNTPPSRSIHADRYYPPAKALRPTAGKQQASYNAVEPLIWGGYAASNTKNGLNHIHYAPKWPLPYVTITITDPNLDTYMNNAGSNSAYAGWHQGYGYQAGAYGGHTWYGGPGGVRSDRGVVPTALALYGAEPNGIRPQGDVPYKELAQEFTLNYFNHGNHFFSNASTMFLAPNADILNAQWGYVNTYYGGSGYPNQIALGSSQRDGTLPKDYDTDGHMFLNGWGGMDPEHCFIHRGDAALIFNSPMLACSSKIDTITSFMVYQNPNANPYATLTYQTRVMAWELKAYALAWKLASTHARGFTRAEIIKRLRVVLNAHYRDVYKPTFIDMRTDHFNYIFLRNMGLMCRITNGLYLVSGGRLTFYMGGILALWKQTGFWDEMYSRGGNDALVMRNWIENLDKLCFDQILDSSGTTRTGSHFFDAVHTSWDTYAATTTDAETGADFNHVLHDDGLVKYAPDYNNGVHIMEAYARFRYHHFPEFTHPRMAAALDKFQQYEDVITTTVNAVIAAGGTDVQRRDADYKYRDAGNTPRLAPVRIGPTVT